MDQLKQMKEILIGATQGQLSNLSNVNTEELGCAIDMIKDLSEAIYYCSIVKSMEEAQESKPQNSGQQQQQPALMYFREMYPYSPPEREPSRMYYSEGSGSRGSGSSTNQGTGNNSSSPGGGTRTYKEFEYSPNPYEGRSTERRKTYMESKHTNDKVSNLRELEQYAQDLTGDIIEMIEGATLEEKQMLAKKLTILANKIQNNNT